MKLLLDTHAFLWFIGGSLRLSSAARAAVEDRTNQSYLSLASVWEMAIKSNLGKLTFEQPFEITLPRLLQVNGIRLLSIDLPHVTSVATLPLHHRDPFDRLLVAQAMVEQIPLISADAMFDRYSVTRLW